MTEAAKYIRAIRTATKRVYAQAYQGWLDAGEVGPAPAYLCSSADARAVRINLHNFLHLDAPACDCAATKEGKWADKHSAGCASLA